MLSDSQVLLTGAYRVCLRSNRVDKLSDSRRQDSTGAWHSSVYLFYLEKRTAVEADKRKRI